jgi:hypothetical protein
LNLYGWRFAFEKGLGDIEMREKQLPIIFQMDPYLPLDLPLDIFKKYW